MTTIEIRNVPPALHGRLKARAARAGKSLSDYLLRELSQSAERHTIEEMRERLMALPPIKPSLSPDEAVRNQRGRLP